MTDESPSPREVVHQARNVAQDVLLTAESKAEGLLETAEDTAEELRKRNRNKPQWMLDHEESDKREFAAIRAMLPSKEEREKVVIDALHKYFETKGSMAKKVIVGTAVVVGALVVILGGIKSLLAWLGIMIVR